jgi:alkylation response protein AidB-like acyl-CoA dehydrogenase
VKERSDVQIDQTVPLDAFRAQVRDWIGDHKPAGLAELADWSALIIRWWSREDECRSDVYHEWQKAMLAERLVCGHWPSEYGGRDLTLPQARVIDEECMRANVPRVFREQGESWVGDTILQHGTKQQKQYFLPRIIDGTHRYCQGFSEPDHGSDLAALETRGVVDGEDLVVSGQKIWTTGAQYATQMFVLCRTDPDRSRRHKGVTFVILDIAQNVGSLEFRPIRDLTGGHEFCETFLDGARAPLAHVIGGLQNGWAVAMTTLDNERGGRSAASKCAVRRKDLEDLRSVALANGRSEDPEVRRMFVRSLAGLEILERWSHSGKAPHQSVEKVFGADWMRQFGELAFEVKGETSMVRPAASADSTCHDYPLDRWQDGYFMSLSDSIGGGTSEIQLNILAERVLELPR